jgi:hypothetical protein
MKIKLVGILVSVMLVATVFTVAQNVQVPEENTKPNARATLEFGADVPQWTVGNTWSYKVDTIKFDYEDVNTSTSFHAAINTKNITLVVKNDSGEVYVVQIDAVILGDASIDMNTTDGPVSMTIELNDTVLAGNIIFNKADLGIRQIDAVVSGNFVLNIDKQPFVPFNIPAIDIPGTINISIGSSVPYTIIDFPLNVSNVWGLPRTNISLDGTIKSIWLDRLSRLNNFTRMHPLLINILFKIINFFTHSNYDPAMFWLLSDFLANPDILPVIHIGPVLTMFLNTTTFEFPEVPSIFFCNNIENITVAAGTFEVFNISVVQGMGNLYYAPDLGTIIKISGNFNDIIPFVTDFNAELLESNYP